MERRIGHLFLEDFGASLEGKRRPELRGRPFVLAQAGERAVVLGANTRAREAGVQEGMPLAYARRRCRGLGVVPPDPAFYRERHQGILDLLDRFAPLTEGTSLGRYFLDLTGMETLLGPGLDALHRLADHVRASAPMPLRLGLAANRLVSEALASSLHPDQVGLIVPGREAAFLAPLPCTALPGIGAKTAALLLDLNIQRVGELAAIPEPMLAEVLGGAGRRLARLSRGIDPSPVLATHRLARMASRHAFEREEIDRERLLALLFKAVEEEGWRLRLHNRYPSRLRLTIRYTDGRQSAGHVDLPAHLGQSDRALYGAAQRLFLKLFTCRVALKAIEIECSGFAMPLRQRALFEPEALPFLRERRIQEALDRIRERYGRGAIAWGSVAALKAPW